MSSSSRVHLETLFRCTYIDTPSLLHNQVQAADRVRVLCRLPGFLKNPSCHPYHTHRASIRKDSNDFAHYRLFCGFAFSLVFANLVLRFLPRFPTCPFVELWNE